MGLPRVSPSYFARIRLLVGAMVVVVCGLCLRRFGYDVGLPFVAVKYGGSVLWGAMVYLLLAAAFPSHWQGYEIHIAVPAVIVVELIRLVHFPALDAFRATTAGALLLGRVFFAVEYSLLYRGDWGRRHYGRTGPARFALFIDMIDGRTSRYPSSTTIVLI